MICTDYPHNFQLETRGFIVLRLITVPERYRVEFSNQGPDLYLDPVVRYRFNLIKGGVERGTPWFIPNAFPHVGARPNVDSDVTIIDQVHWYPGVVGSVGSVGNL